MRSELEVDLAHPGTADLRATHRSLLEETEGLQRLVEDLLLLARSAEGAAPRTDLVALDDLVRVEVRRIADGAAASVDGDRLAPVRVPGDAGQLQRALRNLLDNAVRHAEHAVAVETVEVADEAIVTVDDDGPGVAPAARDRIFDRFTRLDEGRSARDGGSGLGLAITRTIAERHGGSVSVTDSPLGGARFELRLPTSR
jgi:signal transduction histidine kinase